MTAPDHRAGLWRSPAGPAHFYSVVDIAAGPNPPATEPRRPARRQAEQGDVLESVPLRHWANSVALANAQSMGGLLSPLAGRSA